MRCTRVEKFLPLYVAGDLAGRRGERRVANHLATCASCRARAAEYDASRNLLRAAVTLPPDFDGAFYDELRRSVLDEIKRGGTRLAPPAPNGFATFFNARFAYAASLALIAAAVAALSLHSYVGRKSADEARRELLAKSNRERTATPAATATATPGSTPAQGDAGQTPSPLVETTRENGSRGSQAAKSPSLRRRTGEGNAQDETGRSVNVAKHAPSHARRNPLAPTVAAPDERTGEIARGGSHDGETSAAPEVSRIEIQTSDPNIRIIWLAPRPDDAVAQPLK
jgi:Putative zinc-finger